MLRQKLNLSILRCIQMQQANSVEQEIASVVLAILKSEETTRVVKLELEKGKKLKYLKSNLDFATYFM